MDSKTPLQSRKLENFSDQSKNENDEKCRVYQRAKQVLHTALPDSLLCREKETNEIKSFLNEHISQRQPGSLYISGAPGSGKTAVLTKAIEDYKDSKNCKVIYINCMSVRSSVAIYKNILQSLSNSESQVTPREASGRIEKYLTSGNNVVVLVLDEMDSLDSKNQEVLYTVFEWPALPLSSLVLIGIANSLDLTDRLLPRLQAQSSFRPLRINFQPYTVSEICDVIKERLSKIDGDAIFDQNAIRLCAMKVAAATGDIRKALDICRRSVEAAESEFRKELHEISRAKPTEQPKQSSVKRVGIPHVRSTFTATEESIRNKNHQLNLPLQQEVAICTLLLMTQEGKDKEFQFGKFHENYCKICKQIKLEMSNQSEFHSICSLIEATGIISLKQAKDTRKIKVSLKMDESELMSSLQDKLYLSNILKKGLAD